LVECCNEATAGFLSDRLQNNGLGRASVSVTWGPLLCVMDAFVTTVGTNYASKFR
jgi:hypothetical protein